MKKNLVLLSAGFAAGVAFVAACGSSGNAPMTFGPGNAAAQAACSNYQTQFIGGPIERGQIHNLPTGWIPLSGGSDVYLYRCAQE